MGSSAIRAIMAPWRLPPEGRRPEGGSRNGAIMRPSGGSRHGAIIARMAREATL